MTRRLVPLLVAVALTAGALVAAAPASALTSKGSTLTRNGTLHPTEQLRSRNGRFSATLQTDGRFVVRDRGHLIWGTSRHGAHARLILRGSGNIAVTAGGRTLWTSNTAGAGRDAQLTMRDDGALVLTRPAGLVWSSKLGSRCRSFTSGKKIVVDLSEQYAWLCQAAQQVLSTWVTTGAVDKGMGTPLGTWAVQGHQRDRYLYPASGGAYFVHYWMPYDYDYGFHDSSWQTFPYGSQRYRTEGSHGCVHLPATAMSWTYAWASTGTLVRIRA